MRSPPIASFVAPITALIQIRLGLRPIPPLKMIPHHADILRALARPGGASSDFDLNPGTSGSGLNLKKGANEAIFSHIMLGKVCIFISIGHTIDHENLIRRKL